MRTTVLLLKTPPCTGALSASGLTPVSSSRSMIFDVDVRGAFGRYTPDLDRLRNRTTIDARLLEELSRPRMMYLWRGSSELPQLGD